MDSHPPPRLHSSPSPHCLMLWRSCTLGSVGIQLTTLSLGVSWTGQPTSFPLLSAPPPSVHSSMPPQSTHPCSLRQCRPLQGAGPQSCSLTPTPPGLAPLSCPGTEPSLPVAVGDVRAEGQGQFFCSHTLRAASSVPQQQAVLVRSSW